MSSVLLSIALILSGIYANAMLFLLFAALIARSRREARIIASKQVRPEITAAVVAYVAGSSDLTRIRGYLETHRMDLEDVILEYQSAMSGASRDRLLDLAIELNLVQRWCEEARTRNVRRRRTALSRLALVAGHEASRRLSADILLDALDDSDGETRLEAARSLIHSGEMQVIVEVFRLATSQSLIVRAVLADDLRRYALELCEAVVPDALRSGDNKKILATLDILAAWERALPLTGLAQLAGSKDPAIRILALKVLPLAQASRDGSDAVLRALGDRDEAVASAAAHAATRLKLETAMAPLARCLREGRPNLSRAAAAALAAMPPRGWETLEELSAHENPITASAAVEALARARKSTMGT